MIITSKYFKKSLNKITKIFRLDTNLYSLYAFKQNYYILKDINKISIFKCILSFLKNWLFNLFNLIKIFPNSKIDKEINILINIPETVIYDEISFKKLENFFFESFFFKKFNFENLYLHGYFEDHHYKSKKIIRIKDLNSFLIQLIPLSDRPEAIKNHLLSLISFIYLIFYNFNLIYLYKDFCELSIYKSIKNRSIKIFSHQSTFVYPFLCWQMIKNKNHFNSYSMLYSMNSFPIEKNRIKNPYQRSNWKYINLDYFLTWNQSHSQLMSKLNTKTKSLIAGPILYYDLDKNPLHLNGKINITIFDVDPSINYENDLNNYYDLETCSNFLKDITEVFSEYFHKGLVINIKGKPKGSISEKNIPRQYFDLIQFLKQKFNKNINILSRNTNLFNLIKSSDLVIGIPFTSPVFISSEYGVKSIFYDLKNLPVYETGVLTIKTKENLSVYAESLFSNIS